SCGNAHKLRALHKLTGRPFGKGPARFSFPVTGKRSGKATMHTPFNLRPSKAQVVWSLHRGRLRKPVLRVVPEYNSPLYRIQWPDIGPSPAANLTRCKQAALEWAERSLLTDHRNLSVAQRLNSLNKFSWSASPMRGNGGA